MCSDEVLESLFKYLNKRLPNGKALGELPKELKEGVPVKKGKRWLRLLIIYLIIGLLYAFVKRRFGLVLKWPLVWLRKLSII